MAPPERAIKALHAMKEYGFSVHTTKPVLKNLLKVYDQNWAYIEADGYQVLVDALLDQQDNQGKAGEPEKLKCVDDDDVLSQRKRKSRALEDEKLVSSSGLPNSDSQEGNVGKRVKVDTENVSDTAVIFETPLAILGPPFSSVENQVANVNKSDNVPGAAMTLVKERLDENKSFLASGSNRSTKSQLAASQKSSSIVDVGAINRSTESQLAPSQESSSIVDVATSDRGEVKLVFTCTAAQNNFNSPSIDDVIRIVEAKCLNTYKVLEPNFNMRNILKQMCQTFLELGSESAEDNSQNPVRVVPTLQSQPAMHGSSSPPFGLKDAPEALRVNTDHNLSGNNRDEGTDKMKGPQNLETSNGMSSGPVIPHEPHLALGELRPVHDINDMSKGEERVRISLVNEVNSEKHPSYFNYIPQNIVFQNAYVHFSLARISDEDCCPDCFLDCLAAPLPCCCAREAGGDFAYTTDGLLKKNFLDECISKILRPENQTVSVCKDCPLERAKNEHNPETCKGHAKRRFIKECWSKCGCSKECGNRVVQRGIACNLQVFMTSEGKGWGLRTLDELPRGSFVCEYVGEILTNTELYQRTMRTTGKAWHPHPVLLDADWSSEGTMKNEEALCLDATFYGNVARFINHRCHDANLIEVPVQVETPDHHYYHVALFTTRKVEPFEELTWDYGIDFDDSKHPKVFRCLCGSRYCRHKKRNRRRRAQISG